MTRVSGFLSGNDETHDLVRKEMSGVGLGSWFARKLKSCLGCLLGWLIMVAVILSAAGFAVAKTGLVEVPVFSRFYHEPQPVRPVTPSLTTLEETFVRQVDAAAAAVERGVFPVEVAFSISESELTRALQDASGSSVPDGLDMSAAQIAFFDGGAELYVRFKRGERTVPLRLELEPALERTPLPLRVRKARIGEMPIWHRAVDTLFQQALKTQLGNVPFAEALKIKQLTMREGVLDVLIEVTKNPDLM